MSNVKKYLLTAVILGSIAMASGLLIGATNLVTKDPIVKNEQRKISKGLSEIYDQEIVVAYEDDVPEEKNKVNEIKYVEHYYEINDTNDTCIGIAFRTTGSNSYGKVSLIIGFDAQGIYKDLSVITNEQSFASTLVKGYINPLHEAENKKAAMAEVNCGATYGAKLVRSMIDNAQKAFPYFMSRQK